ncbi:hypothetical protein BRADI_1g03990v3 [Brachypodium distachyon]|uniref:Uncharacterized protein n=1 Tax=Brachypodium distachyon TaxID=15368 RepID=A0A2K2DHZ4_BRADI|nr:hypothetical protein BRADI_1g03990v3 [Brachypodium distachyon]PNT73908.1 hypothetical protein BRADI_1g03990v3 [Brachypodium distachyon]
MAEEEEASKVLRQEVPREQEEAEACGPSAPAELATANKGRGDGAQGNKIVITEMEEFVLGLQLNQGKRKLEACDVFKEEDGNATSSGALPKDRTGGLAVIKEQAETEEPIKDGEERPVKPDEVLHEVAVGKGLAGALQFLKDRGTLNEGGNRTTGKKNRLVVSKDEPKEIRIERTDEFGRAVCTRAHSHPSFSHPTYRSNEIGNIFFSEPESEGLDQYIKKK